MEELEQIRQKLRSTIVSCIIVSIILLIVLLIFTRNFFIITITVFLAAAISCLPISNVKKQYRIVYKDNFVNVLLKEIFEDVRYIPEARIQREELRATKMIRTGDRYSSEDYICATYKGIHFEQADVHIEDRHTDSKGHSHYTTAFRGRWLIFDFNKMFKANIIVIEKGFGVANVNRFFGKKDSLFKKVSMESAEFNKRFSVYEKVGNNCTHKI